MAQSDKIVLDLNFKEWSKSRAKGLLKRKIQPWLFYCVDQYLKPFGLSDSEILSGITDGEDDGGIDAIYFLVNRGQLVQENTKLLKKSASEVHLLFFQVKTSEGFKHTEIGKEVFFADDFFNLAQRAATFSAKYNPAVIRAMDTFKKQYLKISGGFPKLHIHLYYITGADAPAPEHKAKDAAAKVKTAIKKHLSAADPQYHFIGASDLWIQIQKRPAREKKLVWSVTPMSAPDGLAGLVKLSDYVDFLSEDGELAERLFEGNVRGFQREVGINKQISRTLKDETDIEFWLLNNGITIICEDAPGLSHLEHQLVDPQIVNGLQTSRIVFDYFSDAKPEKDERCVLVRVIKTTDEHKMDRIIRATNSQNKMQDASLRMTDPIHTKIDTRFKEGGLYYDRKKGYWRDKEKPILKIVSPTEVAQAIISLLLRRPNDARGRPGDFFRDDIKYETVFGHENKPDVFPLEAYFSCTLIVRRVRDYLEDESLPAGEVRNLLYYVSLLAMSEITRFPRPGAKTIIAKVAVSKLTNTVLKECLRKVRRLYRPLMEKWDADKIARGPDLIEELENHIKKNYRGTKGRL